jgi:hypothetical protein
VRYSLLLFSVLAFGLQTVPQSSHQRSILRSIGIKRPNLVVRGSNLSKVELWAIPTGTGITPDEYMLLGTAKRRNAAGPNEIWVFPIPSAHLSVTDIFAKSFDGQGRLIGTKSLPQQGAGQIYDALWGER